MSIWTQKLHSLRKISLHCIATSYPYCNILNWIIIKAVAPPSCHQVVICLVTSDSSVLVDGKNAKWCWVDQLQVSQGLIIQNKLSLIKLQSLFLTMSKGFNCSWQCHNHCWWQNHCCWCRNCFWQCHNHCWCRDQESAAAKSELAASTLTCGPWNHIYLLSFVNIDIYLLSFFSFVPGNTKFMYDLTILGLSGTLYIVMGHFCSDY